MAILKNIESGEEIFLYSHHVVGRQEFNVDTQLINPDVSNLHACFCWDGESWKLKDMSRNGTWLDNHRVDKGIDLDVNIGQRINFGSKRNEDWLIVDLTVPRPTLIALEHDNNNIDLENIHALPDENDPELILSKDESEQWYCEKESQYNKLNDGDIISTQKGRAWRLFIPRLTEVTSGVVSNPVYHIEDFIFHFRVSSCQEHVFLTIKNGDISYDLGERVHHYLLLLLARKRKNDENEGLSINACGWIYLDELEKLSGIRSSHLNIQIFRAKKQISEAMFNLTLVPRLFERRRNGIRCEFTQFDEH